MDTELRDLVARKLQTTLKIDVVRFFVNAFSPLSTAAGVSLWLGVSEETLSLAMEELVAWCGKRGLTCDVTDAQALKAAGAFILGKLGKLTTA